jgi:hypothetical protein
MAEEEPHQFIFPGAVPKDQGAGGMSKLMHSDAQPGRLVDAIRDLAAERDLALKRR